MERCKKEQELTPEVNGLQDKDVEQEGVGNEGECSSKGADDPLRV